MTVYFCALLLQLMLLHVFSLKVALSITFCSSSSSPLSLSLPLLSSSGISRSQSRFRSQSLTRAPLLALTLLLISPPPPLLPLSPSSLVPRSRKKPRRPARSTCLARRPGPRACVPYAYSASRATNHTDNINNNTKQLAAPQNYCKHLSTPRDSQHTHQVAPLAEHRVAPSVCARKRPALEVCTSAHKHSKHVKKQQAKVSASVIAPRRSRARARERERVRENTYGRC